MADVVQRLPGAPVELDIAKGSAAVLWKGIPLAALLSGACIYAALDAKDTLTAVIGWGFSVMFALPAVLALLDLQKLLQPRGIIFDTRGVQYLQGDSRTSLPWETISAIGIGYDPPPGHQRLSKRIVDTVIDPRRKLAIEIFPVDLQAFENQVLLGRYRREAGVPTGLPRARWRLLLPPPGGALGQRVEQGMQEFRPQAWLGWFARS